MEHKELVCQSCWCCLCVVFGVGPKEVYTGIRRNRKKPGLFIMFLFFSTEFMCKCSSLCFLSLLPCLMWVARPLSLKCQSGAGLAWPLHYYPGVSRGAWAWTFTWRGAGQGTGLCEQLCPVLDPRTQLPLTLWRSLSLHTFHTCSTHCRMKSSNA